MTTTHEADLADITGTIWATLFEHALERRDDDDDGGAASTVTSIVHIEGAWQGAVILRCSQALAATLTAEMLGGESAPTFDDIRDALGELTNMVAGNLKAMLPAPSSISLPTVVLGSDYEVDVPGASVVARVSFVSDGHPVVVMLVHRTIERAGVGR
jgi:chemotaxis protein CheX